MWVTTLNQMLGSTKLRSLEDKELIIKEIKEIKEIKDLY